MAKQNLVPPTAQGHKLYETILGYMLDHEADLIHVAGQQDAGLRSIALQTCHEAAKAVLEPIGPDLEIIENDDYYFLLRAFAGLPCSFMNSCSACLPSR